MLQNPETLVHEALRLDREGRVADAIAAYQRVLSRWPGLADCWYRLAVLQRQTMQFEASLASYQRALDHGVNKPEEVHLNRGVIFSDYAHQYAAAERELQAAIALNPDYIPALMNLANLHEDLGRRQPAIDAYERVLALDGTNAEALARYANLKTIERCDDPLIERLRYAIGAPGRQAAERASLGFALGRAHDACGAYAAAFDAYSGANRDSRDSAPPDATPYDRVSMERLVERLMQSFAAPRRLAASGHSGPRPIFVCGMFRSGSTLAEQLLAGDQRVVAGGEIDFLPRAVREMLAPFPESAASLTSTQAESLAARYLKMLAGFFPGADFVTDKRPDNFLYIGLIKLLFPDAQVVHTIRNALDNCLSIYFLHLDQRMSYALDLLDTGHYYRQYTRLMAHWKGLFEADIVEFNYDQFVHAPQAAGERLFASLGLDWHDRYLAPAPEGRPIRTASVWQVREQVYRRSSGRARHYATQLGALRSYLEAGG